MIRKYEYLLGLAGIAALAIIIGFYQNKCILQPIEEPVVSEEDSFTVKGYGEPEETVSYLMAQIMEGNLEKALRCCAIEDVAECFNMTSYLSYVKNWPGTALIPPSDDDGAYSEISKLRLAADYANMIQKCIDQLSVNHSIKIYKIIKDEPENPDGQYFQRLNDIVGILGAQKVCECIVYADVDGTLVELHLSLARYRKVWEIILFSSLSPELMEEPDIRVSEKNFDKDKILNLETYLQDTLPLNYLLLSNEKAADESTLVSDFFLYLQRWDLLSALVYYDFGVDRPEFSLELLNRQSSVAMQIQEFYYQMLLYKADLEWVGRHYEDTPEYIPEFLDQSNKVFISLGEETLVQEKENAGVWQMGYTYDGQTLSRQLTLVNQNGWKITEIN